MGFNQRSGSPGTMIAVGSHGAQHDRASANTAGVGVDAGKSLLF
jgi:hypothetical protein